VPLVGFPGVVSLVCPPRFGTLRVGGCCEGAERNPLMFDRSTLPAGLTHGTTRLPSVMVEHYNVEVKDEDGFVGDRANKGAFRDLLAKWRDVMSKRGADPFGDQDTGAIAKKHLEGLLVAGDPEAAGVVQSAIEEFAQELAAVIRRFLKLKAWRDTERLVVGGGFRGGRVGELAVGRAAVLLKADCPDFELTLIRNDPDHAGLIGAVHLAPSWIFKGHDAILAADIGGTNIRAGLVEFDVKNDPTLAKASVRKPELWRHRDEENLSRSEAVKKLVNMLTGLIERAHNRNSILHPSSVSAVRESLKRMAGSIAAPTTCLGNGTARNSICHSHCSRRSRGFSITIPSSSCTTTLWCRV